MRRHAGKRAPCGLDLLAALTADAECRAVEVLARGGVDARWLADRVAALSTEASRQG